MDTRRGDTQPDEGGRQVGKERGGSAQVGVGVGREAQGSERSQARPAGIVMVPVGGSRLGVADVPVGVGQPGEQGIGLTAEGEQPRVFRTGFLLVLCYFLAVQPSVVNFLRCAVSES